MNENFGGAEDADELGGQEVVDKPFPARAAMQEATLVDGLLDFFRWRGEWLDWALLGGKSREALAGALPVGIQHVEPLAVDLGWDRGSGGDFFGTELDVVRMTVNGREVGILQSGNPFVERYFEILANASALDLGGGREILVGEVEDMVAFILKVDAILEHSFLSVERPLQHVPTGEPEFGFCGLLDAAENGSRMAGNGENFCVGEAFEDFGEVAYQHRAFFSSIDGLFAVSVAFVKILGTTKMLGGLLRVGGKSVPEEEFSPSVGVFQPPLVEKQTPWQIVALQLRLIHQRDCGVLIQAGVKHRCAGAEDAYDEEMLGSLAGRHAGKKAGGSGE